MAFVECPQCGEEYSEHAPQCPNCGGSGDSGEASVEVEAPAHNATRRNANSRRQPTEVVVTDIEMSFRNMVVFMVKWVFASIPAFILIWFIAAAFVLIVSTLTGGAIGVLN